MHLFPPLLFLITCLVLSAQLGTAEASMLLDRKRQSLASILSRRRGASPTSKRLSKRGISTPPPPRKTNKQDFYVDGATIPGLSGPLGDLGPSYAGSIYTTPTSNNTLFFWLWPQKASEPKDEENLILWFNGGPGCSSFIGLFEENGPFSLTPNVERTAIPKINPWSWHKISDIVWIDQPPPTGFATGPVVVHNNAENAAVFTQWLHEFIKIFPEYKDRRITIVAESFGGYYGTYIWDALHNDGSFNLGGLGTVDAVLSPGSLTATGSVWPFYQVNKDVLGINDQWAALVKPFIDKAGFDDKWYADALTYPPIEHVHLPAGFDEDAKETDFWDEMIREAYYVNPCLTPYAVQEKCPKLWEPIAHGVTTEESWINETPGFREAIHAPPNDDWQECSDTHPFAKPDETHPGTPELGFTPFLENVIHNITSQSPFVVIHGKLDAIVMHPGIEMAIQNYTWQGQQGFQSKPSEILTFQGERQGIIHKERNLTFALIDNCGHECPQYNPPTTFKLVQFLLGKIPYSDLVAGAPA